MSDNLTSADRPENAPAHCPGVSSESAGKAAPCAGCPNQGLCSSGAGRAGPDPDLDRIRDRLAGVRRKLLVLSGKGGVGKSTVSVCLARAFAAAAADDGQVETPVHQQPQLQVGLLDVDICGPSVPTMLGLLGETVHQSADGWSPVYADESLAVMSVAFLLASPDEAVVWRGPRKNGLIKQFLRDVDWGQLDYLLIDTPPGTSDEHLSIVQLLKSAGVDGAIIVTTPQEVSLLDARKEVNFCRRLGVPVLGVVENMSGYVCPNCTRKSDIFPATTGGAAAMCKEFGLPLLARVPIEPGLARALDQGQCPIDTMPDGSETMTAMRLLIDQLRTALP
ncbi:hypothetical protein BOX15_Mlig021614g3 [Macrostomum lignano]|uniref:Uncharacterized protein n=2 Tax=Macrostomum lignano TaxID=282301 RepID=A0A267F2I9_9PLAT|nr:hypothetical protein BOX15_Mlig021614g3 [Macrostomum lignano]